MDSYPLLQYLDLSHSRIAHVEDDALGRLELLESLFLDHNLLMRVPSSLPPSLEHLFLQHNQIMELPPQAFVGLVNLQTLDLSGNRLIFLPALALPKLLTLNLQSSGVESVSQSIVHTLPQLRDLLLEDNPIRCSDLLGIAEWASPCRSVQMEVGQSSPVRSGGLDLKSEYLQFHDFYENFPGSSRKCEEIRSANDTKPPSCTLTSVTATSTPKALPKAKKSKAKSAEATTEAVIASKNDKVEAITTSAETSTETAATATQSAGNTATVQSTAKTLRPTATTSLDQLQRQEPKQTTATTRTQPKSQLNLVGEKSTSTVPILAAVATAAPTTETHETPTTAINSSQTEQLTMPKNISDGAKTTTAPATTATAIKVPQKISQVGKKSDKMPDEKAQETLLKYPTEKATATATPPHKHTTLQLHVKDRHLIGTPLLMHKGDVLLVDAEQLLLPGTATVADAETEADFLDKSQKKEKLLLATDKRQPEAITGDTKSPSKSHKKKPSLSIKKMTYSTKHAVKTLATTAAGPAATSSLPHEQQPHQHSSVNTPRDSASQEEFSTFAQLKAYVELKTESKPEHLMDQRQETLHNMSGSHPGVMLLVACILVIVLLAGLAHVYRCELPWQRGNRSGQLRPHHQRHQLTESDDVHSFLHYQGSVNSNSTDPARLQKWHHSTRREAPYSSPLHNLQARELQQQQRCHQFYSASLAGSNASTNASTSSSSSGSSSRTSLHSPSREDSYYIEMAPSSPPPGVVSSLPMELLGGRGGVSGCRADRMAATDLGGTTGGVPSGPSSTAAIKSVSSRLMAPSSRKLGIW